MNILVAVCAGLKKTLCSNFVPNKTNSFKEAARRLKVYPEYLQSIFLSRAFAPSPNFT